jgi:gamma-glutamyltranspeptidase / glutathione hydrolase
VAATFEFGAVVGQPEADSAAVSVLKKGGNAVDAAVTAALLSGVVAPQSSGIGGFGGFMTVCIDGEVSCIDFNTLAPQAAHPKMFQVARSDGRYGSVVREYANELGYQAISVPGVLAGMDLALEKFGGITMADALKPAIRACDKGFRMSANLITAVADSEARMRQFPETAKLFMEGDELPKSGTRGSNPHLGKMLAEIAELGVREFYEGKIADRIVKHIEENGGILSKDDLASYQARLVDPIHSICMEYDVYSPPLCSAGVSLVQMCALADEAGLDIFERDAPKLAHGMIEMIRASWMDRYRHFGDPQKIKVPMDTLMSDIHLGATSREINKHIEEGTRGQALLRPMYTGGTTHISVVDAQRNMASLTLTHGPSFGSFVTIPRMGLLMNGGMSRFDPGSGLKNSVDGGKAPITNMCPTVILREDQPFMSIGASGGTRIPSSMFQVLARRMVLEEDTEWSIAAPRVHSEGNEWVRVEEEFGEAAPAYLKSIGYDLNKKGSAAANVRLIEVKEDGLLAAYDPRMKAKEKGY